MPSHSNRATLIVAALCFANLLEPSVTSAQTPAPITFADLADLTLGAPIVLQATITKTSKLGNKDAPDVPPGHVRMLIEANVQTVLVAPQAVPASIRYLWEGPLDPRGKAPKLKGTTVMLFLRPVAGKEGQFQLADADGQLVWTPAADVMVRRVMADARDPDLRGLHITGVANAFHVRGSIAGEAESQIFLTTSSGRPVSLVVLARPGMAKSYSVALSDVIDDAATTIPRDTLLWYHLACALPDRLPEAAVADVAPDDRAAVEADYRFVLDSLGRCVRTLD